MLMDDDAQRILGYVQRGPECWPWTGGINKGGYGVTTVKHRSLAAHRTVYVILVGPIPPGLDLGHLCHDRDESCLGGNACHHRRCCNPKHLEPMTKGENARGGRNARRGARATHCPNGHPFTDENTYWYPDGVQRQCLTCRRASDARRRARAMG